MSDEAKRAAAIEWLGEKWLLHPSHAPQRRHVETVQDRIQAGIRSVEAHATSLSRPPPADVKWKVEDDDG